MSSFSEKYGLNLRKQIQLENVDLPLLNRLWNIFYEREYETEIFDLGGEIGVTEYLLDSFGLTYEYPQSAFDRNRNIEKLRNFLIDTEWYLIYDFIERYVSCFPKSADRNNLEKDINRVLEEEKSGYRMLRGLITPITNIGELDSLKESMSSMFLEIHTWKRLCSFFLSANPLITKTRSKNLLVQLKLCAVLLPMKQDRKLH